MTTENQETAEAETTTDAAAEADKSTETGQEEGKSLVTEETSDKDAGGEKKDGEDQEEGDEEKPKLPESPDQYDLTIPDDIGLKDANGDPVQFDADDPLAQGFRDFAHKNGLTQDAVGELVKMYATATKQNLEQSTKAADEKYAEHKQSELQKLEFTDADGKKVTGGARLQKVLNSLDAVFGKSASKIVKRGLINSSDVIEVEKLVAGLQERIGKGEQGDDLEGLRGAERLKALRSRGK